MGVCVCVYVLHPIELWLQGHFSVSPCLIYVTGVFHFHSTWCPWLKGIYCGLDWYGALNTLVVAFVWRWKIENICVLHCFELAFKPRNGEYGVQNGPEAFKLQMKAAMDDTLHHTWVPMTLFIPIQIKFFLSKVLVDGRLAKSLFCTACPSWLWFLTRDVNNTFLVNQLLKSGSKLVIGFYWCSRKRIIQCKLPYYNA